MSPRRSLLLFLTMVLISVAIASFLALFLVLQDMSQPKAECINIQLGLKLTASLEKRVYRTGEPINITMAITNISNETVTYAIGHSGHRFDFRVYNSTLSDIYQWSRWLRFAAIWDEIALEPGQSLAVGQIRGAFPWVWTQICNKDEYVALPVAAGTYCIVGQTGPIVEVNGNYFLGEHRIIIETSPMEIAIVDQ